MAVLNIPDEKFTTNDPVLIKEFLNKKGIFFDQWFCSVEFPDAATQEEILAAYHKDLEPFMQKGGYTTADVISINNLSNKSCRDNLVVPSSCCTIVCAAIKIASNSSELTLAQSLRFSLK